MVRCLSWNVYHGSINGVPPVSRIGKIVTVGMQNTVDVIALQECPQSILDSAVKPFGAPGAASPVVMALNATVPGWDSYYSVIQAWSENNPNSPNSAVTADGYLIFYRDAVFAGPTACGYYWPDNFHDLTKAYLRPPVRLDLALATTGSFTVMNWHVNIGAPQVTSAVAALNALLPNKPTNTTVVLGDFNYAGSLNNIFAGMAPPFPNWDDNFINITNNSGVTIARGLDHILTSVESVPILADILTFKSDAYHYPLAVAV